MRLRAGEYGVKTEESLPFLLSVEPIYSVCKP